MSNQQTDDNRCLIVDIAGTALTAEDATLLANPLVGGIILFTRNFASREQIAELCAACRAINPQLLIVVDYEGGRVQRFREQFTRLPPMRRLGELYAHAPDDALKSATNLGWLIGYELGSVGIDMPLAPVVDLDYGCCDVIGDRAFARDASITLELALAVQAGLVEAGMAATAKHFPGHGAVVEDSHAELPVDGRPYGELENDIAPYRGMISHGLASVMMAHIRYPAVDDAPASLSSTWIKRILREQLGFDGAVFCDDLSMGGAAVAGSYTERAQQALAAGCDLLPVCNNRAAVSELLENLKPQRDPLAARRRAALRRRALDQSPDKVASRHEGTRAQLEHLKRLNQP